MAAMDVLLSPTPLILLGLVTAAVVAWTRRARGIALGLLVMAAFPLMTIVQALSWPFLAAVAVLGLLVVRHRWTRSSSIVSRWGARSRRKSGVASTADVFRFAGSGAMLRKAGTVRPSLEGATRRELLALPVSEVAVRLCRSGSQWVWSSVEDVVVSVGGPRSGKSGWLAGQIIDAPGAVLATSTRLDLRELCTPYRERKGPVVTFNPSGLGGVASSITFDPLTGCEDPVAAAERAADLLSAVTSRGTGGDREYWDLQGRRVLEALLHAAALGHRSMREVLDWTASPESAHKEVTGLLRRSPEPAFRVSFEQFVGTNDRTRTSITSTIMPALGWLTSAAAREAAGLGPEGARPFDVAELLATRGTVFLLGGEESHAAPLVTALTGYIAREARRIAATKPGGRLDPGLRLALDEAALICPVPLEAWTADMGGRGVTILIVVQSRAQLLARYGEHGAATILNNAGAVMVFGGTRDREDLQFWSTLTGERDEPADTLDPRGRTAARTTRKTPVLAPAQIANLPTGKVLVIRRGIPPVVGRAQMAWRRRDLRWARFCERRPRTATRLVGLAGWLPGAAKALARVVPGWPGPAFTRPAAVRLAGDALVVEGQVVDVREEA
ncbi:type IV secretory system conjugative DNA transfer family protein [Pseudonocardia sp. WMMC193]|uniref:type IV secretory system conjugative DNA transfer family protein n=1 Tax=Pseudonocardia sp. WMMC193 TaxID=2911965 RepID=UPI001F32793B|nr:TraM recognition domain-containing protein [Pseudonocardia sp. WMMC193]MCF7553770.1 TraM recognition domain-containing protein [Pseudonocardia sp. WMMC193]